MEIWKSTRGATVTKCDYEVQLEGHDTFVLCIDLQSEYCIIFSPLSASLICLSLPSVHSQVFSIPFANFQISINPRRHSVILFVMCTFNLMHITFSIYSEEHCLLTQDINQR